MLPLLFSWRFHVFGLKSLLRFTHYTYTTHPYTCTASTYLRSLYYLSLSIRCLQMFKQSQLPFLLKTPGRACQHEHLHHACQNMAATPGKPSDLTETSGLSWKAFIIHCRAINIVWHRSDRIRKVTVKWVRNLFVSTGRSTSKTRTEAASQSFIHTTMKNDRAGDRPATRASLWIIQ